VGMRFPYDHTAIAGMRENSMEITEKDHGGITVLSFVGSLDALTSPEAMETLEACAASGKNQIVADLSGVDFIRRDKTTASGSE